MPILPGDPNIILHKPNVFYRYLFVAVNWDNARKETKAITIKVKRTGLDNATASLNIRPASTLVATAGTGFKNYMTSVSFAVSSIEVRPILTDSNATVSLNGAPAISGSFSYPCYMVINSRGSKARSVNA